MHKLGNIVVNNTDNLLISGFVGVITAGIYSNYYLIIGSVRQVLDQAFQGVAASVGNLGITEEKEKVHQVFLQLFFIGQWMYGVAGICLFEMLNPFVELAFGKKYLFPVEVVLVLCVNFAINGAKKSVTIFKESMGLFWNDRYKAIVEAVLNLGISVALVVRLGVTGVFLGTIFSMLLTSVWIEPYVIYKHSFERSPGRVLPDIREESGCDGPCMVMYELLLYDFSGWCICESDLPYVCLCGCTKCAFVACIQTVRRVEAVI